MRLKKLILHAFGHFTDKQLDFGEAQPDKSDFHIIYGGNEAGKTTIMEAWLRFLYGIPKNEAYGFQHLRKNLKIAAVLETEGQEHYFARLPQGHSSALQNADGRRLAEEILSPCLRGLGEQDYRNLLCLDDKVIEQGGQDIMASKGDMGRLLFAASAGLADFSALLEETKAQAQALYRPRNGKAQFAELKNRYEELSKEINAAAISAARYEQLKAQAQQAYEEEHRLAVERRAVLEKLSGLREAAALECQIAEQKRQFAEITAELAALADALGVKTGELTPARAAELYQSLKPYALPAANRQKLQDKYEKITAQAQVKQAAEAELKQAEERFSARRNACAALRETLPQKEFSGLAALLRFGKAAALKQTYMQAQEKQREAADRRRQALSALAKNGQNFAEVPHTGWTVQTAAEAAAENIKRDAEFRQKTERLRELQAEYDNACAQLRALYKAGGGAAREEI